jgi:O-antigen ligase
MRSTLQPIVFPIYGLALALPVSIALININKFLAFVFGLVILVMLLVKRGTLQTLRIAPVYWIYAMLLALAASLTYTTAPWDEALSAFAKYGKLLLIPLCLVLIRNRQQAMTGLMIYMAVQTFVVASSWLLYLGFKLPYVPVGRNHIATVFSSSLDQAILTAGYVAVCWHLASELPGKYGRLIAWSLVALGVSNIFIALYGRSGQVCVIAVITLSLIWAVPKNFRAGVLLAPIFIFTLGMLVSPQFNERFTAVAKEVQSYRAQGTTASSSGLRLHYWKSSLKLMSKSPAFGHGVGTWHTQFNLMQKGLPASGDDGTVHNPHQEYLLWGVQLGALGIVLLAGWMISMAWHARHFDRSVQRATQCMAMVFAVACMFNSALFDGMVGDYFCVMLGMLLALGAYSPNTVEVKT